MLFGMTTGDTEAEEIQKRVERLEHLIALLQGALGGATIQRGTTTLVQGTTPVPIPATITANSRILLSFRDAISGNNANTAKLDAPTVSRSIALGNFVINALTIADAVNNTDVSTVDWAVIN